MPARTALDAFLIDRLKARNPPGPYLELGGGKLLDLVAIHPRRYLGIETEEKRVRMARWRHPQHRVIVDDPASLQHVGPGSQGAVLSFSGMFGSWLDPAAVFREIRRVLQPGGTFLIVTRGAAAPCLPSPEPYLLHTPATIRHAIWRSGLELDRIHGLEGPLGPRLPALLGLESRTLGKLAPTLCRWLVIEGRRS